MKKSIPSHEDVELFFTAIQELDTHTVKLMLDAGMPPDVTDQRNRSALDAAVEASETLTVMALLDAGANPNRKNRSKANSSFVVPLNQACALRRRETVSLLLDRGADPRMLSNSGQTCAHYLFAPSHAPKTILWNRFVERVVETMLDKGLPVNASDHLGRTPLHVALEGKQSTDVVRLLLARGANPNQKNDYGNEPIHYAAEHSMHEAIGLLVAAGADIDAPDHQGRTALFLYRGQATRDAVLACHPNLEHQDGRGDTALHYRLGSMHAATANDEALALVQAGADPTAKNSKGQTAIEVARERNLASLIPALTAAAARAAVKGVAASIGQQGVPTR